MKNRSIFMVLSLLAVGCSSPSKEGVQPNMREVVASTQAVEFATPTTRVASGSWSDGEMIGVHMRLTDGMLVGPSAEDYNKNNRCYEAAGSDGASTKFVEVAESERLYYPQYDAVNLYAYAPFQAGDTYICNVDVASQSNPAAIDLIVAEPLKGVKVNSQPQILSFSHKLARLTIDFAGENEVVTQNMEHLTASVSGVYHTATYDTMAGQLTLSGSPNNTTQMVMSSNADGTMTASAIVIPQDGLQNKMLLDVEMEVSGERVTFTPIALTPTMLSGKEYHYTATVGVVEVELSASASDPQISDWKIYKEGGEDLSGKENGVETLE